MQSYMPQSGAGPAYQVSDTGRNASLASMPPPVDPAETWEALASLIQNEADLPDTYLDENVRLRMPGASPLCGEYAGREEVAELFRQCRIALKGKYFEVRTLSCSRSQAHLAMQVEVSAEVNGRRFEWKCTWACFMRYGCVHMLWLFIENQNAFDEFWTLALTPPVQN